MDSVSEQEFFATVVKLLAWHSRLTLGEIRNKTRAMRRRRHIANDKVFSMLENYTANGWIRRTEVNGRIAYCTRIAEDIANPPIEPRYGVELIDKRLVPTGIINQLKEAALARGRQMNEERKQQERMMASYVPDKPYAKTEEERKKNEKEQRIEHKEEMKKAEAADLLAELDEPDTHPDSQ